MSVIYETRGRAREYMELACNLYEGCEHHCTYCYSPDVLHKDRQQFHASPRPRPNILYRLEKDAERISGEKRQILLCFTCDPYQPSEGHLNVTRQAIMILHKYGLNVCVLTKGGTRALKDFDLFTPQDSFATTLTCIDPVHSSYWEPRAATPEDRLSALAHFHNAGIPTWVSLEPVLYPMETLRLINVSHPIVDEYKVGKLNYHPLADTIDWADFAHRVVKSLERHGKKYYIKKDLAKYLQG